MTYKKLNFLSDTYFVLILILGFSYLSFLVFSFVKIFPAFAMQLIFLIDSLKFGHNVGILVTSRVFLFNFIPGLLLAGLLFMFFKAVINLIKNVWLTFNMVNGLAVVKKTEIYTEFESKIISIFTIGFISPRIFVSSAVFKNHTKLEIKSMLQHEVNHQQNLHPLKIFISNFIKSFTPTIPGKAWLFESYLTSTEVSSDTFSEDKVKSKIPLVSALLKFQNQTFEALPTSISYFNSQSERIKILVGQKKQFQNIPMVYGTLVIALVMISALSVKNTNLFYECQHLASCVETLMAPNGQSLTPPISSIKSSTLISDHCQ